MLVYAYEQGGATTAGLVALAQLVPAGLFAPFAAVLADRLGPARMLTLELPRAGGDDGRHRRCAVRWTRRRSLVYALAASAATCGHGHAAGAVGPHACARAHADELTAANVVSGWIESVSVLSAPAAAGVLLGCGGVGTVFAVMAAAALAGGLLTIGLPGPAPSSASEESPRRRGSRGVPCLAREPDARLLVALLGAQFVGDRGARRPLRRARARPARPRRIRRGLPERGLRRRRRDRHRGDRGASSAARRLAPPLLAGVAVWVAALAFLAAYARTIGSAGPARGRRRGSQPARRRRSHAPAADRAARAPVARLRRARGLTDGWAGDRLGAHAGPRRAGRRGRRRVRRRARPAGHRAARGPGPARLSTAGQPCRSWSSPCSARHRPSSPSARRSSSGSPAA